MESLTTLNERLRNAEQTAEFLRRFLNCMLIDIWQRDPSFHANIVSLLKEKGIYGSLDNDSPLQIKPFVDVDMEGVDQEDFYKKDDN